MAFALVRTICPHRIIYTCMHTYTCMKRFSRCTCNYSGQHNSCRTAGNDIHTYTDAYIQTFFLFRNSTCDCKVCSSKCEILDTETEKPAVACAVKSPDSEVSTTGPRESRTTWSDGERKDDVAHNWEWASRLQKLDFCEKSHLDFSEKESHHLCWGFDKLQQSNRTTTDYNMS